MASEKSPVDRLLDAGVYAPLGFLLQRDKTIADLAAAGRKQIAFSRSLGRAALKGLARGSAPGAGPLAPVAGRPKGPGAPAEQSAAVEGYEQMTAKQAIALIAGCSDAQAVWIQTTETATKNRVTVLRALGARD